MKEYKRRIIETEVVCRRTCDICGYCCHDKENWSEDSQDWDGIEYTGTGLYLQHSDETSQFELVVDICPLCFAKKLVPWLRSQGATVQEVPSKVVYYERELYREAD